MIIDNHSHKIYGKRNNFYDKKILCSYVNEAKVPFFGILHLSVYTFLFHHRDTETTGTEK